MGLQEQKQLYVAAKNNDTRDAINILSLDNLILPCNQIGLGGLPADKGLTLKVLKLRKPVGSPAINFSDGWQAVYPKPQRMKLKHPIYTETVYPEITNYYLSAFDFAIHHRNKTLLAYLSLYGGVKVSGPSTHYLNALGAYKDIKGATYKEITEQPAKYIFEHELYKRFPYECFFTLPAIEILFADPTPTQRSNYETANEYIKQHWSEANRLLTESSYLKPSTAGNTVKAEKILKHLFSLRMRLLESKKIFDKNPNKQQENSEAFSEDVAKFNAGTFRYFLDNFKVDRKTLSMQAAKPYFKCPQALFIRLPWRGLNKSKHKEASMNNKPTVRARPRSQSF